MHRTIVSLVALGVAGCAGGPGAPEFRSSEADGLGPMIADCRNLAEGYRQDQFVTDFYLSTWSSALAEGAAQGAEGVDSFFGTAQLGDGYDAPSGVEVTQRSGLPNAFCRRYPASPDLVFAAARAALGRTGYPIAFESARIGALVTDYMRHGHQAAEWFDSYQVRVKPESQGTVVMVRRPLFISRDGRLYNEAESVGRNEAWLLTQIGDGI